MPDEAAEGFPPPLDLYGLAALPVPQRVHRVGQIMPLGTPGVISAHGGMGKTQLAADLVLAVADGGLFMGMDTISTPCAILSEEDDAFDWHFRIAAQCRHRNMSMADVANRLSIWPAGDGSGMPLVTRTRDGIVEPTSRYMKLRAELIRRDVGLLVLDNLAALCAVEMNNPSDATQTIAHLGALVHSEGNVAIIAHVDKASAKAGYSSQAFSGTAAWHNRARWRWYLYAPGRGEDADASQEGDEDARDDGRRILEIQKVNAGQWGQRYALRIGTDGVIGLDGTDDSIVGTIRRSTDRRWMLERIRAADAAGDPIHASERANRNLAKRLQVLDGYPRAFRGRRGAKALFQLALRAKADGLLTEDLATTASRHSVPVWRLTDAGLTELAS